MILGMMRLAPLRPASIRAKLLLLTVLSLILATLLVFALVSYQQQRLLRTEWVQSLAAQARLVATNSRAAVAFHDPLEAHRLLAAVQENPAILRARLYTGDGALFAAYLRPGQDASAAAAGPEIEGHRFSPDSVTVWTSLVDSRGPLARVEITASLAAMHDAFRRTLLETGAALLLLLSLSLWLASGVVRRLSAPVEDLSALLARMAADTNLRERANVHGADEIAGLGRGLNHLIDSLQARDAELADYREKLEQLVELRTRALHRAMEEAHHANQVKSDFLAHMSHEIRTPLNAIVGMSHLLSQGERDDVRRDRLEKLVSAAEALIRIVDDVLDFAKIEAGRLGIEHVALDLDKVVADQIGVMEGRARAKGLELRLVVAPDVPRRLRGDPLRLGQILLNLLGNAIKFTDSGSVSLTIWRIDAEHSLSRALALAGASPGGDHGRGASRFHRSERRGAMAVREAPSGTEVARMRFEVRDTGIGIPVEHQSTLFNPFTQADASITRRFGGTGLGLAICKQLVELMNGEIGLASTPGEGCLFHFELPFELDTEAVDESAGAAPPQAQPDAPATPPARTDADIGHLRGARVLLVDDVALNREVALAFLRDAGVRVDVACDGREAVESVAGERYDLVLMDIQMPVLDGLAATRAIRADPRLRDLPIVAMTAHALPGDRERSVVAGMNDHLTKPLDPHALLQTLARWIPSGSRPADIAVPSCSPVAEDADTSLPPLDGIDVATGLRHHMGREGLYRRMLNMFQDEFPTMPQRIATAGARGDLAEARRLAHACQSAAASIGARELARCARGVEAAYAGGQVPETALSRGLVDEMARVTCALAALSTPPPLPGSPRAADDPAAARNACDRLIGLLRAHDAAAGDAFEALRRALPSARHETDLAMLRMLIEDVEYEAALEQLGGLRERIDALGDKG